MTMNDDGKGDERTRREFLLATGMVGTGLLLNACGGTQQQTGQGSEGRQEEAKRGEGGSRESGGGEEAEVSANEDLMREHGILRRSLIAYAEAAAQLRRDPARVPLDALRRNAELFRDFGENYHEKQLEEQYVFPAVRRAGGDGKAASYPDILIVQHERGREVTDYILAVTRGVRLSAASAEMLAQTMDGFVRMYNAHAAREDTIVFPAWKKTLSKQQLDEMGEQFEEIEHRQFGKDGFDDAERRVSEIEAALGIADLAQFTPPAPPTPPQDSNQGSRWDNRNASRR